MSGSWLEAQRKWWWEELDLSLRRSVCETVAEARVKVYYAPLDAMPSLSRTCSLMIAVVCIEMSRS